jgi:hypothetical protein
MELKAKNFIKPNSYLQVSPFFRSVISLICKHRVIVYNLEEFLYFFPSMERA